MDKASGFWMFLVIIFPWISTNPLIAPCESFSDPFPQTVVATLAVF
jgi:hypothetical protein